MSAGSSGRTVRTLVKQTPGRRGRKKSKPAGGSRSAPAPDFLKQRFLSISFGEGCNKNNWQQIEQDFFTSVANICALYKIELILDSSLPFPMNIASAYRLLKERLEKHAPGVYLVIAENRNKTTLATVKPLTRNYDLCFVPLSALDEFHQEKNRSCFELLLSVFSYLNSRVRMPLISENDYLTGCYEAITEWVTNAENDLDEKENNENCADLKAMSKKINILEKAVRNPLHLTAFGDRLRSFIPANQIEKSLKSVALKFHRLYAQFPHTNFYKNISCDHLEEDEGERAYPDHYFSFFWDDQAWMYDHLMEYVNCDLQEMAEWEVPVSIQYFDRRQNKRSHQLPFETRLLELIGELCSVLYRHNYEKHHS